MDRDEAITEMESLLADATAGNRVFNDTEEQRFRVLRQFCDVGTTLAGLRAATAQPTHPTRAVAGAARRLSDAIITNGDFAAKVMQNGRARIDIPVDIRMLARAVGSDQALNPLPGIAVQPQNLGLVNVQGFVVNRLLSALASIPVTSNAVVYTRVKFDPDVGSPSTSGNSAARVQELAQKPESYLDTEQVTADVDTWATFIPASKQILDDLTGLRATLDFLLLQGLLDKTDAGLFSDMTTAGRFVAYNPTSGDAIQDGVARIATALVTAGASNVKVAMHPNTLLASSLVKASGSGEYLGMPSGIPATLVSSASVTQGKLLAWSDTGCVWAAREGTSLVAGLNGDDLTHNRITLLAEHRGSLLTLNPAHVRYGDATV
jgi:hypothetical protein